MLSDQIQYIISITYSLRVFHSILSLSLTVLFCTVISELLLVSVKAIPNWGRQGVTVSAPMTMSATEALILHNFSTSSCSPWYFMSLVFLLARLLGRIWKEGVNTLSTPKPTPPVS